MNNSTDFLVVISLFVALVVALVVAIISWRYADFFLSRRDHYVNSRYELLTKKIGWFISAFLTTLLIVLKILDIFIFKK